MNFLEGIHIALLFAFVIGFTYPDYSLIFSLVYFVGRFFFSLGYKLCKPKVKSVGAVTLDIALISGLILTVSSAVKLYAKQ